MKCLLGVAALTVATIGFFPDRADAGNLDFTRTTCDQGVSVAWITDAGLHTTPQTPPTDVWSMVVDEVSINGVPTTYRSVDGVTIQTEPVTATGLAGISITLHWHAVRPDGSVYDSPPLYRTGTVSCSSSLLPSPPTADPAQRVESPSSTTAVAEAALRGNLPASGTNVNAQILIGGTAIALGFATRAVTRRRRVALRPAG